jgi:hypothetical protein
VCRWPCSRPCLVLAGIATASAPTASAYVHRWSCGDWPPYERCYDESGATYNNWRNVEIEGEILAGYCAKGVNSGGGVIQFGCASNSTGAGGCVNTGEYTHAYGYDDKYTNLYGYANTEYC